MKRILIIGAILVIIIVIVVLNVAKGGDGQEVETALAKFGPITSTAQTTGVLRAKAQVDVSAEVLGRVKKIYVKEGDIVKKGKRLIELDDRQDYANLTLAKAKYEQATLLLDRTKPLLDKKLISQEEYDATRTNYEVARAQYLQATDKWEKTRIDAPISGKIMKLSIEEGETVILGTMNNPGTVLITIADMSTMIANVQVDETEIPNIKVGMTAKIIADAMPDTFFEGSVTKVGLMPIQTVISTETATNFEVEVELSNFSPDLRPGMSVQADVITNQKDSVLIVPIQAVGKRKIKDKEATSIFAIENDKAVLKEIETGVSSDTDIEIKSGLQESDVVIIGPYRVVSKLKDGNKVKAAKQEEGKKEQKIKTAAEPSAGT